MSDYDVAEIELLPEWRTLLAEYQTRQAAVESGWVERLQDLPGLEAEQLPRIHGKLIALGLLEFQLADRTGGMRYQLSTLAARLLSGKTGREEDADCDDDEFQVAGAAA